MAESVPCPNCEARLDLPVLPIGQPVQCPRCRREFEPCATSAMAEAVDEEVSLRAIALGPPQPISNQLALAAIGALALLCLTCACEIYVQFEHYFVIHRQRAAEPAPGLEKRQLRFFFRRGFAPPADPREVRLAAELKDWQTIYDGANALLVVAFVLAGFFFLLWLHQASHNAWSLHAEGLMFPPLTALWLGLMPVVNFIAPYLIVQEIWRASNPQATHNPLEWKEGSRSRAIRIWWACFLAPLLSRVCVTMEVHFLDLSDEAHRALIACVSSACLTAGAALTIYVIGAIWIRQNARYDRLIDEFNA